MLNAIGVFVAPVVVLFILSAWILYRAVLADIIKTWHLRKDLRMAIITTGLSLTPPDLISVGKTYGFGFKAVMDAMKVIYREAACGRDRSLKEGTVNTLVRSLESWHG
jgi:hypothetical protein